MKKTSLVIRTVGIILIAFSVIFCSSCSNSCKNVNCQNTSGCNGGDCSCPAGYSGHLCELSSIVFVNKTPTDVYINVNGATTMILPTYSVTLTDTSGKSVTAEAYTYTGPFGTAEGDTVKWPEPYTYPVTTPTINGTIQVIDLNVGNTYFLLKIINNDASQTVDSIVVNNGGSTITTHLSIPNNDTLYNAGYYPASTSTYVTAYGSGGGTWLYTLNQLGILFTSNQTSTITIP